ncbi:MAG: hypothetical protein KJ792_01130, partial [Actinobacteria bacterium]|nr:hypothetical protein [Actinomycetota bacterium]
PCWPSDNDVSLVVVVRVSVAPLTAIPPPMSANPSTAAATPPTTGRRTRRRLGSTATFGGCCPL